MGVGMTTVFGFLSLLVVTMMGSAAFFERFGDWFEEPAPPKRPAVTGPSPEIAVVLAAIEAHRRGE